MWRNVDWLKWVYRSINQLVCQIYTSVEFDTDRCVCRLNLVDGRMPVYRSINQFVSHICVSVEFDSEGVEFGRQGIGVEYYLC